MTVSISKPAVNLREELASLRNQGGYEEQQFYFDNLVTNGTFDTDTNWTKGTGWTISGGVATANTTLGSEVLTSESNWAGQNNKAYHVTATVTMLATPNAIARVGINVGGLGQDIWAFTQDSLQSGQTYHIDAVVVPTTAGTFLIRVGSWIGLNYALNYTVDNISIFETDGTDVVHRMPKGWVPKDVYEDGLLQREGAANDYEVVYDGFDYYVKPAVAPSATTQTCVIGVRK